MATGSATASNTTIGWTATTVYDTATPTQSVTTYTGPNGQVVTFTKGTDTSISDVFNAAGIYPTPDGVGILYQKTQLAAKANAQQAAAAGASESTATPVSPVTDATANAAQTTAVTDSGANATPTQGSTPETPPADALQQTPVTAQPIPTQGTTPQDIPADAQGTDPVLGPDAQLPPDDGPDTSSAPDASGTPSQTVYTQQQATLQDATNFDLGKDWRVRLALAPGSNYLYNATPPGILGPLKATQGVIFPYTPDIQVSYTGNYEPLTLTHSNYKVFQYQSSSVDQVTIACAFTAQDTTEALYMLAAIHFFRSATKMFYGQDQNPNKGLPPPLCYLYGLGAFQFDNHPLVISSFTYTLPNEVDYIRVSTNTVQPGVGSSRGNDNGFNPNPAQQAAFQRLGGTIAPGGTSPPADFGIPNIGTSPATYVPTMMNMSITCYPIVNRNDISNNFSLRDYATGQLITKGIW